MITTMGWGFTNEQPLKMVGEMYTQKYIYSLVDDYDNPMPDTLVADLTWLFSDDLPRKTKELLDALEKIKPDRVVFTCYFDEQPTISMDLINTVAEYEYDCDVHYLGYCEYPYRMPKNVTVVEFQSMALTYSYYGQHYTIDNLMPNNGKFDKVFLSYLGKTGPKRTEFFEAVKHNLDKCILSYKGYAPELENNLFQPGVMVEPEAFFEGTFGLGNLDYWRQSFLNVVSETCYLDFSRDGEHPEDLANPFISEKLFKAMLGYRPFLVMGPKDLPRWMENHNFLSFNSFFGFNDHDSLCPTQIADIVNNLTLKDAHELWPHMQSTLQSNFAQYYTYASNCRGLMGMTGSTFNCSGQSFDAVIPYT